MAISRRGGLSLNLEEMQKIKAYFRGIGRNPTDVELETLAQTWSEHCVHKTLRGLIRMDGELIDNLLKSTIMRVTGELARPWCLSVFKDNAGVIAFDESWAVCFKVETHNHPSAIEPYGGANTGIGGVIRDPMGTGMGAKPIANTDVFCFAPLDYPAGKLPQGVLHPKRIMKGVVAGVRDYGNRMGIPTVNGAILFDERYLGNPLVYCGNVGLLPLTGVEKAARAGDLIYVIGGRTGRDGIHGATFSSVELTEDSESVSSGAVQIGNAIEEKKMVDVILQARDLGCYSAITDCGAGGLSSAVGEMGERIGAEVDLSRVPLKYEGLTYTEIWISEAQERMVLAVRPEKAAELERLCRSEDVEATRIGEFKPTGRLRLTYEGVEVCDLDMGFLHGGVPRLEREASWTRPAVTKVKAADLLKDPGGDLKRLLASPDVASKEWVVRQYDHEVQGGSVLKPLVGPGEGPGDGAVLCPVLDSERAIVLACGICPRYGDLDPYRMGASAVDEAVRNAVACGADPERLALLDNFCWGNTDRPEVLGSLVLAARGAADAARAHGTPFISGKDSLNNEYRVGDKTISIPGTLLISALGVIDDWYAAKSIDLKKAGDALYLVGFTRDEMGGSQFLRLYRKLGDTVPEVELDLAPLVARGVARAVAAGMLRACHDLSDGGLAVALAEMIIAGRLGAQIDLASVQCEGALDEATVLFSESNSRFLAEVEPAKEQAFVEAMGHDVPVRRIGAVIAEPALRVIDRTNKALIDEKAEALAQAWRSGLGL